MQRMQTNVHSPGARIPVTVPTSGDPGCVLERIHLPRTIQPHGALLAVEPKEPANIIAASSNIKLIMGDAILVSPILGAPLSSILGAAFTAELLKRFHEARLQGSAPWQSTRRFGDSATLFDVTAHANDGMIIVEIEQAPVQLLEHVQTALHQLQRTMLELRNVGDNINEAGRVTAHGLRLMTGYERVVIYKFDTDWNGLAIAESKTDDWDNSLHGLRFPASDIPAQARALYGKVPMRWVPDRDALPAAINVDSQPRRPESGVDLTFAILRSPSPVYLQIHQNLGINGTLTFSIMQNGKLWGLAICHHRRPHSPDSSQRAAASALVDAFALRVSATEYADMDQSSRAGLVRMARLLVHMATSGKVDAALTSGEVTLVDLFASSGAAVLYGDSLSVMGDTPPEPDVRTLVTWISRQPRQGNLFQTNKLAGSYPPWTQHAALANGVLAVFLAEDRSDVLLWFRPEEIELVSWGGSLRNGAAGDGFIRPDPSKQWTEMRHGFARPWDAWEMEMASKLPNDIAKVMIREFRTDADTSTKLRQSQKMEALGLLAGGIAHDFNNIIQSVYSAALLIKKRPNDADKLQKNIAFIVDAAERGTAVTRRLLTFSHQSVLQGEPIDAVSLLADMQEMLVHTIGAPITTRVEVKAGLPLLWADKGQLETALVNLASNARDAMPSGGVLTFSANHASLQAGDGPGYLAHLQPGSYVKLSVSDTGIGMPPQVLAHVSEPFFTTKPLGQGTGLGLAVTRGFVDQSGGCMHIESAMGHGTMVSLWFPAHQGALTSVVPLFETQSVDALLTKATARLLIVDDDTIVRATMVQVLEDEGYSVISAASGSEALLMLNGDDLIDLVITDYSMPDMDGVALIHEIHRRKPHLPTILLTGFMSNSAETAVSEAITGTFTLLRKPISSMALADQVAALLKDVVVRT